MLVAQPFRAARARAGLKACATRRGDVDMKWLATTLAAVALTAAVFAQRGAAPPGAPAPSETPRLRYMGPESSGRIASVAGVPGDNNTYYAGAASGGVWKTTGGAKTFEPLFDDQPVQAIGALAVSATNPSIVWAGTGEAWTIRDSHVTRAGVYQTTDGGRTWTKSLFADANTGCSGLALDAHDPNVLIAGMWQVELHTWAEISGGPGSAVYQTRDGGATWKKLENGLPKSPVGKIDVAIEIGRAHV